MGNLRHLGVEYKLTWIVCGDFNEIMYASKKRELLEG